MQVDKYVEQDRTKVFINFFPHLTNLIARLTSVTNFKRTIKNVNTSPVSKISWYLNLIIFGKHKLSLLHKISNSLAVHTLPFQVKNFSKDFKRYLSEDPGLSF